MFKKIKNKKSIFILIAFLICLGVTVVGESRSSFSDSEKIKNNKITIGEWKEEDDPKTINYGDVIINEIHWAASPASANDQWIELFNTTDKDIDLQNWIIKNASMSKKGLKITGNPTVKAGSYLLITRREPNSAESALTVSSDVQNGNLYLNRKEYKQLILKDDSGNIKDKTPNNSPWPEGKYEEEEKYFSMQRKNETKKEGEKEDSWYTCNTDNLTQDELDIMKDYWKDNYHEYICGTPGNSNLPSNDQNIDNKSLSTPITQPSSVDNKEEGSVNSSRSSMQTDSDNQDPKDESNEKDNKSNENETDEDENIKESTDEDENIKESTDKDENIKKSTDDDTVTDDDFNEDIENNKEKDGDQDEYDSNSENSKEDKDKQP